MSPSRNRLAILAVATMALSYLDRQVLALLAPTLTTELHITQVQYGLIAGAFSLSYLLGTPLAGLALDKVGAAVGLLVAVVAWSSVSAMHALATGAATLVAGRMLLGLAEAPSYPGAARVMHGAFPGAGRSRALGFLLVGSSVGAMAATGLVTFFLHHGGWRLAFVGTALTAALWIPGWIRVAFAPANRALLGSARQRRPGGGRRIVQELLLALRIPLVRHAMVAVIGGAPVSAFFLLWGAKYLVEAAGVSATGIGRYLWLPPLLFDLGAVGFGDLAARASRAGNGDGSGARRVLFGVAALFSATAMVLPAVRGPWVIAALAGVSMAGAAGMLTLLTTEMLRELPSELVARAAGFLGAAQSLAYVVANPIIGRVVASSGYSSVLVGLGTWALACAGYWLARTAPRRRATEVPALADV